MIDESTVGLPDQPETERAEWQRPEVRRIDANEAEITPGGLGDAGALS